MVASTREWVRQRGSRRCEYCHISEHALDLPFHVDHVVASVHRADDDPDGLAWPCPRCNLRKGPNLSTIDPETDQVVEVFNPRTMGWTEHFAVRNGYIEGITPCGRGTVRLLDMNNPLRLQHRRQLIEQGDFLLE